MKFILKVAATLAGICLCRLAIEKVASSLMVREVENYLESVVKS